MNLKKLTSAKEWLDLPEFEVPTLKSSEETGSIIEVAKLDYYLATKEECAELGIKRTEEIDGVVYALAVAMVKFDKEFEMCRVPLGLTAWACQMLALIQKRGLDPFPAKVEFGVLDGRSFGEVIY